MAILFRTFPAVLLSVALAQPLFGASWIDLAALPSGSYEITTRLELPHLERWAIDKTAMVCLSGLSGEGRIPIPILSANNPYATCRAANLVVDSGKLEYDVVCPGRDAAKAHAVYSLDQDKFAGRVAMVMGGKNMTMTEVQRARRVGTCSAAAPEAVTQF